MNEDHPMDDEVSCAWCGNFLCCMMMRPDDIVRRDGNVYCDQQCASS